MKNYLAFFFVTVFVNTTASLYGQFTYFEAEGSTYHEALGGKPGSGAEFYSERWGGHLMHTSTYNNEGKVVWKTTLDKQPAFVLNTLESKGNGKVTFIGACDFSFNHFSINVIEGKVSATWFASVKENINIAFVIQQSTDGQQFLDLKTINGQFTNNEIDYSADLENCNPGLLYRIKIIDLNTGAVRYTTKPKAGQCSTDLILFPSISSTDITVIYDGFTGNETYQVIDMKGNILKTGQLQNPASTFEITDLSAGIYIFYITNGQDRKIAKFIKN